MGRVEDAMGTMHFWLRGVDLNHRPLGYEPKRSALTRADSVRLPHPSSKNQSNLTRFCYLSHPTF